MTRNMGIADRTVRFVLALAIAALYLDGALAGTWAIVLGVVAVVLLVTSLLGSCPADLPFGFLYTKRSGPPPPVGR